MFASAASAGPYHDPDHARGELPAPSARDTELAGLRASLDRMYAHRAEKIARYAIDEDALFAAAKQRLAAATTWAQYDAAIYDALAAFHDGHLTYKPPATAAPSEGYASWSLGFSTVLAGGRLLVASVEPGGSVAAAGIAPGDEVVAIDGVTTADELARVGAARAVSRPESATTTFARTWTTVLYPKRETTARARTVRFARRRGGEEHASEGTLASSAAEGRRGSIDVTIAPALATEPKRPPIAVAQDRNGVAIVTVHSLDGDLQRAALVDDTLAAARTQAAATGIAIDLRGVRGGVDLVGYRVVGDLAEGAPSLGSYRVLLAPDTLAKRPKWQSLAGTADAHGFSPPQPLTVTGLAAGLGYRGKVAVIIDAACASTCEVVAAALRADLHAIVVGATTAGSSGAPVQIELPASRGRVGVPTWELTSADGKPIEDDGVAPDLAVDATPDALAAGVDLPLQTAIDRIAQKSR